MDSFSPHRKAAAKAAMMGVHLNQLVHKALEKKWLSNQISGMKSKNMYKPVCLLLIYFSLFGCISKHGPKQVNGQLRFGEYSVLPPKGYWYFPRKYPAKFKTSKDYFVITFWKDKDTIFKVAETASSKKPLPAGYSISPFFNFFITK
ncbi:MAG: hypothetical protein M0Z52_05925 [Actinomycetota bacterium]|nr:hypothetical protein [Actinomycetota bacterium]